MARVAEEEVREVIETDPEVSLIRYIKAANILTDRVEACATSRGRSLTDDQLEMIELYLAAYYYSFRDPMYTSKSTERASASFQARDHLDAAKSFDTSGCLNAFLSGARAGATWLGKAPSAQIDYEDRD